MGRWGGVIVTRKKKKFKRETVVERKYETSNKNTWAIKEDT